EPDFSCLLCRQAELDYGSGETAGLGRMAGLLFPAGFGYNERCGQAERRARILSRKGADACRWTGWIAPRIESQDRLPTRRMFGRSFYLPADWRGSPGARSSPSAY